MGEKRENVKEAENEIMIQMPVDESSSRRSSNIIDEFKACENPSLPLHGTEILRSDHESTAAAAALEVEEESTNGSSCCNVCGQVGFILFCIPFIPLFLLYALFLFLVFGKNVFDDSETEGGKDGRKKGIYQKVQELQDAAVHLAKLVSMIRNRVLIFVLLWLVINLSIGGLREKIVLGSKLWKWSLLIVIVSCGYHAISLANQLFLYFLTDICKGQKDVVYYARGLRRSINMVIYSSFLLLVWHFYFRSHNGLSKTSDIHVVLDYGTRTFISFLIFSILWLLKNTLLLKWEADAVYKRFSDRILRAGFQLYFLNVISGTSWDIFRPQDQDGGPEEFQAGGGGGGETDEKINDRAEPGEDAVSVDRKVVMGTITSAENERKNKEREEDKKRARDVLHVGQHMLSKDVSTYGIKQMAEYFVALATVSSREGDGITDILVKCSEITPSDREYIVKEDLSRYRLDEKEMELLYTALQDEHQSQVKHAKFENWMIRAHKNCLALGCTLADAKEVVYCLQRVMNCFVIVAFILSWLLLTEIATTKVLVIIASPLLAATFIFGDTCKTLFEGIIFAFIKHPFDVGDRCVIDGTEQMEVKHIYILTTTLLRMGTKEEVLYPNSILAAKAIVNLKGDPDPNDTVELSVDWSTSKSAIDGLETRIREYFNENGGDKYKAFGSVMVKQLGTSIKIVVHFEHVMNIFDVTHSQCNEKKNKQRSELLLQVKQFLDDLKIKVAAV